MKDLIQTNIHNLREVWQIAGAAFDACVAGPGFHYCGIPRMEWPNRLWFDKDITEDAMAAALPVIQPGRTVIPYWQATGEEIILAHGGVKAFEQAGMSLKLEQPFRHEKRLSFRMVRTVEDAALWAGIYPLAFGYRIAPQILEATCKDLRYYLALLDEQPVGTAILHLRAGVAGIHGVGVIPAMRRKGLANEIMAYVLNDAIAEQAAYAVLQASQMGKGIYLGMGFTEDFTIRNYAIQK